MKTATDTHVTHILLIEDDKAHQDLVLRAFRDDPEPYRLSVAANLREARLITERDLPDLILADWVLPDGKGLEILMRRDGAVTIPLIIMTSYGDEHLAVEIMKSGAIDYVVKSATMFAELPRIIKRALRDWENIQERKRAEEAVQDTHKRLADILSFLPDAVLAIDNDGRVIAWNDAMARMTGVPAAEMLGKGDYEYSLPFYGERRPILIDLVLMDNAEIEKKYDYIQRDGDRITSETYIKAIFGGKGAYLWGTATPLYDNAGNRNGAIEVIRDITERKQNEELRRQREATLETLLNAPKDTIALLDPQGIILGINDEGARRLGGTVQTVTGRCAYDLLPSDLAPVRKAKIDCVFKTGKQVQFDDERSGTYLHNEIYPILNPERTAVERIAIFARDITDQKRAEQALQESETRFKELFNNIGAGVAIYEATPDREDFIIRDVNRAVETIEQVRKDEIVGRRLLELFPGVAEFGLFAVFQRVAETGIPESHPVSMYHDGRISGWRENYVYRLPSGEVVALYEDVTEKKQAEEAEQETRRKYAELFELGSEAIFLIENETGAILEANTAACEMYGYSREALFSMKNTDLSAEHEETHKVTVGTAQGTILIPLRYHRRNDGTVFPVEIIGRFFTWNNRQVHIAAIRDITSRIQAEAVLRESEERYRLLFDSIDEGFCVIEMIFDENEKPIDYLFLEINPSFEKQTGIIDAQGRRMREIAPNHEEHWFEIYGKIALTGQPVRFVNRAEQLHRWYDVYAFRFGQEENRQVAVLFNDITEKINADAKLTESEDRFRHISELITDIAYSCKRPTGGVFSLDWITGASGRITGFSDNEILAMGCWRDIVIEEDYPIFDEKITGLSPGLSSQCDLRIRSKDGVIHWLSCFTECVNDPAHLGYHILFGGCRDISENKQTEEIRNAYQVRLDSAMEIGNLAWWEMDLPNGAVRFDDRKATMLGYTPEKFRHYTDFTQLLHPDDDKPTMQAMKEHLEGREARYHADYRIRTSDGTYRWFRDVGGITRRHADGSPATVTGIVIDITAGRQAEEALRETETRFRALIQNSSDIIRILDCEGRIVYESPSAERILGYLPGFLIGKDPMAFVHPDDVDTVKNDFEEVVKGTHPGTPTEFRIRKADGEYIWVDSTGTNLLDVPGVNGIVITTRPIQQRKLAEEQINRTIAQLEQSEALLRKVYDILPIGLWLADKTGKLLYGNPAGVKIWGAEPQVPIEEYGVFKARHYPSGKEIAPDDWALAHTILEGVTIKDELLEIDAFDGKKKIIVNYTAPLYDAAGAIDGAIIVNQEITDRVAAEQLLRVSGERLSLALEATSDGLWDWDLANDHVYWSPRTFEMLGYAPDEFPVNFRVWKSLIHPDEREATENNVMTQLKAGNRFSAEFQYRTKSGSWMWILGRGRAVAWDREGNVTRMVGTHVDLTGQKKAERALKDNQARLATAMDIAGLVNWEFDVATGMFTFDDRFYSLYETTAEREGGYLMLAETYLREFVYPDDRAYVLSGIQKILATSDPAYTAQVEHRITPRDGSVRTIIARYAPVMGPDGTVIRTFGANQDITDFKLMESEIRSLNTVLEQRVKDRTEALVETNEKLEEENAQRLEAEAKLRASLDEKVMLLKEIHHRVKNNLQIIASLLNLQSRYITDESTLAAIRESQNRVKAMALVHEKLYRAEDISHISLQEYIRFLGTGLFQFYDAKMRGIQFTLDVHDIDVDIDSAIPLGLIINELISNSLKYAFPEGRKGEVSVSVKKEEHTLNVLYRDTGIGIPAELDWRNTPSLGLRLVNTLVDQMDGTVELDRSNGTLFTMVLHEKDPRGQK